jgi:hypothetical protein
MNDMKNMKKGKGSPRTLVFPFVTFVSLMVR